MWKMKRCLPQFHPSSPCAAALLLQLLLLRLRALHAIGTEFIIKLEIAVRQGKAHRELLIKETRTPDRETGLSAGPT